MNLRANFDKNKKASRIKALREFTMKRLTDFFGEKDWKTVEIRYNENMKRSKHCCWTVPMSDWNLFQEIIVSIILPLNRTYEWLKLSGFNQNKIFETMRVTPYLWEIDTQSDAFRAQIMSLLHRTYERQFIFVYLIVFTWILWIVLLISKGIYK